MRASLLLLLSFGLLFSLTSPTARAEDTKTESSAETKTDAKNNDAKSDTKTELKKDSKADAKTNGKADPTAVAKSETKAEAAAEAKKKKVTVGSLVLKSSYPEGATGPGLFGEMENNLSDLTDRLEQARKDDKIAALVLNFRNPTLGRGKVDELRAAIKRTRSSGKKVYASLQSAMSPDYMVATACDEIVMPESGMLFVPGVRAELVYFKRLFDKLGVQADFIQVGDYKGAEEPFTRDTMSPEFRRQFESVIDDYYEQLVTIISESRKLDRQKVRQLIDQGLFTAQEAKTAGLIDRVVYEDELAKDLAGQLKTDEVNWVKDYGKKELDVDFSGIGGMMKMMELMMGGGKENRPSKNKKIAVVYAVGVIAEGESEQSMMGGAGAGSDTIVKALKEADDDPKCVGIVLRVDSPGGSGTASDIIWRQVTSSKKPVIASMGDIAASGGYYISMGAKKIFAEPGTLTGSIGVISGKMGLHGLFDKVGVTTDVIRRGQNAGLLDGTDAFTTSEREVMLAMMKEFYDQFTKKAAEGRKMDLTKLRDLAQGKLYTGRMAASVGLVDTVGTLDDAIAETKKIAGVKEGEKIEILELPKPKSILEHLLGGAAGGETRTNALAAILPPELMQAFGQVQTLRKVFNRPTAAILPFTVEIK